MKLTFRPATINDAFPVMELYQRSAPLLMEDLLFLEVGRMKRLLSDENAILLLAENDGHVIGCMSLGFDFQQRIAKIYRMLADFNLPEHDEVLCKLLDFALEYLKTRFPELDLIYTTTLSLRPEQQKLTSDRGFKLLGVFPNAASEDKSGLNGLTAYFFHDVLEKKRFSDITLHPALQELYSITQEICGLPALPTTKLVRSDANLSSVIELERIAASNFVAERFNKLRKSYTIDTFYPFQIPNLILCDAKEDVEVFVRFAPENRFASIIGERVRDSVDPVVLYTKVANLLKVSGAAYIEVINDAGDTEGNEVFLQAGFTPCSYFPCLKRHGEKRRDYVVFGRSFEYQFQLKELPPLYAKYYRAYAKIEFQKYGL